MLNDPRSHGLWEKTAAEPPATSPLAGAVSADVVIVGGGYTGLSSALHLAEAGSKVVLLEAKEIGFGGAGRNVGLINAGMWVMPDDLPGVLGPVHGERLLELLGNAPKLVMELIDRHGVACELERNGTLHCAVGADGLKEIEERAAQWSARGAAVTLLDAAETARRIGSDAYTGSLLDMRAGTLQPLAYARGLAHAAVKSGVVIHTSSPVVATERHGSRWKVKTESGEVSAEWIIVATDAYSTGPWEQVRSEQVHLPYFNFATVPLGHNLRQSILAGREGAWDTKEILSSFRMDQAGRLVFGSVGALRNTGLTVHKGWAKRALKRLFPVIGDVEFECEWYGQIGMTDNALPRFHKFAPNVVGFSGYNGRGIAPGTVFGRTLAEHILGRLAEADLPLPLTSPTEPRLRALKELWYEAGAQVAHFADARF
ncbi:MULTISPECIES: FAD-binding oxidoreductase [unclassified Rhizobium]|uniref:NAD(P)/FAD-dependent oxidoreductase n=1 Tax=unclassified Rhizobium TaxID=2613769 RepID=UPI001A99F6B7|nr:MULTISPECIES: FAD-binding oxidoreductase [unclassified Rhizobium]MBX5158265.1 FAD-binding oxidoreductase [Rhizobium sp. NZLR8]MBX5163575.1 FAD-binding oxidoreductase [Rhizobium sp. NZLR4b]MBX5182913.1 FAD-binding oxidoreductase [Rhizobium sp. NZLR5]MBX5189522.1 FAD-binding oxidoreductase [Rhizobium sp. NZLR3b]MBX5196134.1 FAD-binding oxidoreductase [Rhizobium sp. NZLR10]